MKFWTYSRIGVTASEKGSRPAYFTERKTITPDPCIGRMKTMYVFEVDTILTMATGVAEVRHMYFIFYLNSAAFSFSSP